MPKKLSDETIGWIMMCRACNMSHRKIAEYLHMNEKTVKKYVQEFEKQAEETSVEETVMDRLSPVASVVIG